LDNEKIKQGLFDTYLCVHGYIEKLVLLDDVKFSVKKLIKIYVFMKLANIISEKLVLLIFSNIIIFYVFLESIQKNFLYELLTILRQVVDGFVSLIQFAIPKYEESDN